MSIIKRAVKIFHQWKDEIWANRAVIFFALFLLALASIVHYNAGTYAERVGSAVSGDLILDNIPAIDLGWLYVYVWLGVASLLFLYPLFFEVSKIHELISQFSLLTIIRSFFATLTHLKMPANAIPASFPWPFNLIVFQNDLFFSGQVAVTFLGFLIFKRPLIKYFFLAFSIIFGITALLMHQHYSIDILSAYFIAYGSYKLGQHLFAVIRK